MGVRDVLPILSEGRTEHTATHTECRECGRNLTVDAEECPECGGSVATYDLS